MMTVSFRGLLHDELAAMLGGNAAIFFRFDSEKLAPIAARVGPERSAFEA